MIDAGHELIELPPVGRYHDAKGYAAWLGVSEEVDAAQSADAIAGRDVEALIVDHYALGHVWEEWVRPLCQKLLAIDDLANRRHSADFLVDVTPELDTSRYASLVSTRMRLLLGPQFSILRPEFRELRASLASRSGVTRRVFITFGAHDGEGWTEAAIVAVRAALGDAVAIDVAVGTSTPHAERLREFASSDERLALYFDTPDIAKLMAAADLGIGAGGTTSWERACLGLPSILTPIADNQRGSIAALSATGCALSLAASRDTYTERLTAALAFVEGNPGLLKKVSVTARSLVDGAGVVRIVREIFANVPILRIAGIKDAENIWRWRNAPTVRELSRDPTEIARGDHQKWYQRALKNPNIKLLICEVADEPVAVLRFDFCGTSAEISIYLTPRGRGRGLGVEVLRAGESWLRTSHSEIERIVATILPSNGRSIAAFTSAGYELRVLNFERELL